MATSTWIVAFLQVKQVESLRLVTADLSYTVIAMNGSLLWSDHCHLFYKIDKQDFCRYIIITRKPRASPRKKF